MPGLLAGNPRRASVPELLDCLAALSRATFDWFGWDGSNSMLRRAIRLLPFGAWPAAIIALIALTWFVFMATAAPLKAA